MTPIFFRRFSLDLLGSLAEQPQSGNLPGFLYLLLFHDLQVVVQRAVQAILGGLPRLGNPGDMGTEHSADRPRELALQRFSTTPGDVVGRSSPSFASAVVGLAVVPSSRWYSCSDLSQGRSD